MLECLCIPDMNVIFVISANKLSVLWGLSSCERPFERPNDGKNRVLRSVLTALCFFAFVFLLHPILITLHCFIVLYCFYTIHYYCSLCLLLSLFVSVFVSVSVSTCLSRSLCLSLSLCVSLCDILPLQEQFEYNTAVLMFKVPMGSAPQYV